MFAQPNDAPFVFGALNPVVVEFPSPVASPAPEEPAIIFPLLGPSITRRRCWEFSCGSKEDGDFTVNIHPDIAFAVYYCRERFHGVRRLNGVLSFLQSKTESEAMQYLPGATFLSACDYFGYAVSHYSNYPGQIFVMGHPEDVRLDDIPAYFTPDMKTDSLDMMASLVYHFRNQDIS